MTSPPADPHSTTLGPDPLVDQLRAADTLRQQQRWPEALAAYRSILLDNPHIAVVAHNIAVCHMALRQYPQAEQHAQLAQRLGPQLWQSGLIAAKAQHLQGMAIQGLQTLYQLSERHPQQPQIDLEIARRNLHTLCHPKASAQAVEHLLNNPHFGAQAHQMTLLAQLYDRPHHIGSAQLSQALVQHAQQHIQPQRRGLLAKPTPGGRHRIGIIGNQLHSSPVYYLAIGALRQMSADADIIVFNRSAKTDWATREFESLATEWHTVTQHNAKALAETLRQHPVHALIDLCGWMDPTALQALATQPAMRQYKWVGGQSVTTGLKCFSGFITDEHHTPEGSELYYTEPLLRVPGGYVSYTPPPYMPEPQHAPSDGVHVGIIANPAKLSDGYLAYVRQHWATWQERSIAPLKLHLIDKRYALAPLQQRISDQLMGLPIEFVTPSSHADYLSTIGRLHAVLDTWPYSGGLTTLEAHALGVPVYTRNNGLLFSERHSHAHNQYLGMDLPTVDDPDFTPAHALLVDRRDLRQAAARRQQHSALAHKLMSEMTR